MAVVRMERNFFISYFSYKMFGLQGEKGGGGREMFVKMKREREKDDASHGVSEYIWVCVMLTVVVLGGLLVGWWLTAAAC